MLDYRYRVDKDLLEKTELNFVLSDMLDFNKKRPRDKRPLSQRNSLSKTRRQEDEKHKC